MSDLPLNYPRFAIVKHIYWNKWLWICLALLPDSSVALQLYMAQEVSDLTVVTVFAPFLSFLTKDNTGFFFFCFFFFFSFFFFFFFFVFFIFFLFFLFFFFLFFFILFYFYLFFFSLCLNILMQIICTRKLNIGINYWY